MIYNNFHEQKENKIDFIDRTIYRTLITDTYTFISKNPSEFKIIFLYGPGGFGKTALLDACREEMQNPAAKPIYVSLEITSKDDEFDILIKFRKSLPQKYTYPLFDYAIQFLWNSLNTSQLDDEFLDFTKNSLWQFAKSGADIVVSAMPVSFAMASFADLIGAAYKKLKKLYGKCSISTLLDEIENMQPHDLIRLLPQLLGIDIHNAMLEDTLVFIIDSYSQYSRHIIDTSSWLITLIQNIGYGLFVITSRENISWPKAMANYVISKELDKLPEDEVRIELKKQFNFCPSVVDNIVQVTGCIPIYLDLAIKSLQFNKSKKPSDILFFFKSKKDIVCKFLIHLPENEKEIITILAIVEIFNQEIFEYLVKDLQLPISVLHFTDICQRSLIRTSELDNRFYKIHEVISKNISRLTDKKIVQYIFKSYLRIIRERVIYNCTNIQISMLFKHIISLIISNNLFLTIQDTERLLDIYFVIKESLLPLDCDDIQGMNLYQPLRNIYFFIKALNEERESSHIRLEWLNSIQSTAGEFGKHIRSFRLMKGYLQALCEGAQHLKVVVEDINSSLVPSETQEWYYGQTKIFYGDCKISYGNFQSGINELEAYKCIIPKLIGKENDAFQVTRHIAHGYRFNMYLEKAETLYRSLIEGDDINPTPLQKIYIFTNLCETCCYFKSNIVLEISIQALELADKFNDLKSKGKIHYSLAIAYLVQQQYELVEEHIHQSLHYNEQDGYQAGQLYAYMARSYYEYARYGCISVQTFDQIKDIQNKIQVYGYFSLPLALMQEEYWKLKQIREEYEWINFNETALTYRKFLDNIQDHKL